MEKELKSQTYVNLDSKGRILIPGAFRELHKLNEGDRFLLVVEGTQNAKITLTKIRGAAQ